MTDEKRELLARLVASLREKSGDWRWGNTMDASPSWITHVSGLKIYIGGSGPFLWQPDIKFGFFGRRRLRRAFRYWRSVHGAQELGIAEIIAVRKALSRLETGNVE